MLNARRDLANAASGSSIAAGPTAVMVMNAGSTSLLCPFFVKCDGVLLINSADGSREFHPRDRSGAKSISDLLLELKARQLVCGFVDDPAKKKLRAAGVNVRLGSCSYPVDGLVASFSKLPKA